MKKLMRISRIAFRICIADVQDARTDLPIALPHVRLEQTPLRYFRPMAGYHNDHLESACQIRLVCEESNRRALSNK